ncbi:MAG: CoA-binding protein [Actinobacteria bacterium]|nr:CoA-binding protein [Actinomycetota bacterium]MDA2982148.1 CoA-binding protein [Actinomycetota bacterium]MDA2996704.1 CoA-binding protein [Actinomycetota bacterium]
MNQDEIIKIVLGLKTWAVVGLGNNPERAAFGVSKLLQDKSHRIVPVYPRAEMVHGEVGYKTLSEIPFEIDVVDCFVNSNLVSKLVDEAIAIGAKAVWLQLGVIDQEAVDRAKAAGLLTVMDRCPAIEYQKNG